MPSLPFCLPASAARRGHGCPAVLARWGAMQYRGHGLGGDREFAKRADQGATTGSLPSRIDPGERLF